VLEDIPVLLPSVSDMPEFAGLLDALLAQAQLEKKSFDRDQLARRMGIVLAAGITDPDEFRRCVLSEDGA
jgi:hypothetical protein